jgi:hypothetical protein
MSRASQAYSLRAVLLQLGQSGPVGLRVVHDESKHLRGKKKDQTFDCDSCI